MVIQTSGVNAISISSSQAVTLANPLPAGSGGTGLSSLGTGVATFLGTPSSANLLAAVTDETGTGALVFAASPTLSGTPLAPTAAVGTNTTQIATTAFVQAAGLVGEIKMWGTASAPTGYLLCDGSSVSTTTYAALFAVIGYTFGGSGASFTLPDYRGRMPIGVSGSYALASTGGSANAVVVSHTHTATSVVTDPGHTHTFSIGPRLGGSYNYPSNSDSVGGTGVGTNSNTTGITVATTNSTEGVSGTGANLPPYLAINFIIKT
jgi:microcystin-dependent protein